MPQLTQLVTGVGVVTSVVGQAQCENMVTIGDATTANPLSGLQIEIDSTSFINITGQTLITAFMKWLNGISASAVASVLKLGTGKMRKSTNYRFTNAGATTPIIYATSDAEDGVPMVAGTKQINASSYEDFQKFSALFIGTPANVTQVEVLFNNGAKNIFSIQEIDAMYAIQQPTEANARLGGVSVINNNGSEIKKVRIYCSVATTVLVVKLPDSSFEVMKAYAESLDQ